MKVKIGVTYTADGVVEKVDDKIIELMKEIKAEFWASEYTFGTHVRDLAFEMEVPE